jgi:hypothetical protein
VVEPALPMVLYCGFGLPVEMGYLSLTSGFCEYPTYRLTLWSLWLVYPRHNFDPVNV